MALTRPAVNAFLIVQKRTVIRWRYRVLRAQFDTITTSKATFRTMNMLFGYVQPFRIMAPPAGQRTPFKKNSRPDTGAIVDGIFF
jgi:hypothetical protein